eukprot:754612-Pleurochrysis_carterae.AAC.1
MHLPLTMQRPCLLPRMRFGSLIRLLFSRHKRLACFRADFCLDGRRLSCSPFLCSAPAPRRVQVACAAACTSSLCVGGSARGRRAVWSLLAWKIAAGAATSRSIRFACACSRRHPLSAVDPLRLPRRRAHAGALLPHATLA